MLEVRVTFRGRRGRIRVGVVCSGGFGWADVSGAGRLATWTIVRDAFLPAFAAETPYVVGEVELAEHPGLRIVARVVGVDHADLRIGLPLRVEFVERGTDDAGAPVRIPIFVDARQ